MLTRSDHDPALGHRRRTLLLAAALTPVAAGFGTGLAEPASASTAGGSAQDALSWFDTTVTVTAAGGSTVRVINDRSWAIAWSAGARAVRSAPRRSRDAFSRAALASALHTGLSALTTGQQATLDAALADALARIPDGRAKRDGVAAGAREARALIADREGDGLDAASISPVIEVPAPAPGIWQPTAPSFSRPTTAGIAHARPFALESAEQFRPAGPPPLGTDAYRTELDEVRTLGRIDSTERTEEQSFIAQFWLTSAVPLLQQSLRRGLERTDDLLDRVELVALTYIAQVDSQIAGAETKYHYWHWRPITAVREDPENPEPEWTPFETTPSHPDYISGTSLYAGVGSAVLGALVPRGPGRRFQLTSPAFPDTPRSYSSWAALGPEAVSARVFTGIHFRTAGADALTLGADVADHAVHRRDDLFC
ncbi:vanadium-dependent haloperoxidase [Glycomyces harbinensis]|uniref:PAP2 superfamily protein n=1 Tax=Glycomyces harbinensis TaxID=58114 RepID=A0A1G6XEX4_9ACTN|nr:vanadium-dependent haloperoxidase [Glycomyces harbinensis]SDD75865.1 hypothetical protein SAMN05216270_10798 [Glycomyces harbinensis]